jgi:predicted hydrocarbon binding protein
MKTSDARVGKQFPTLRNGKVYLWGVKGLLIDTELFHFLELELINNFGAKKSGEILYEAAHKPALELCRNYTDSSIALFLKKFPQGRRKITEFFEWLVTNRTGYGVLKLKEYDEKKLRFVFTLKHSAIAKYFKTKEPVCSLFCAQFTAGVEALFDRGFIGKETKCIAKGDPYCEIVIEAIK